MNLRVSKPEYFYQTEVAGHHHAYLLKPLMEMISVSAKSVEGRKVRILDIGFGNGSLSNFIAQQGYEVVGVEESQSGVKIAQQSYPDCKFIAASIYDFPYEQLENSFDIIISTEVIEHLPYPRELAKVAKRCLKNDGTVILTTPYHGYFKNLVLAITGKLDKHFTVLWDGGHIKFFSVKTLSTLLIEGGFINLQFKFAGRYPFLWKSMLVSATLQDHPIVGAGSSL
jgi:2-polyprenyl-3-methyl-5-hydroxy-6-metoxy-1,4-benzoquinol methylase